MIAAVRIKWPSKRIMIGKTDLYAAYQCVRANAQLASTCITIVGKLAFLCLRLSFGATPALEEDTTISDSEIYLGNDLHADASWYAMNLQSPHRHLLPREDYLPASDLIVK